MLLCMIDAYIALLVPPSSSRRWRRPVAQRLRTASLAIMAREEGSRRDARRRCQCSHLFLPAHWHQHTRRTAPLPPTLCPTAAAKPAGRTESSTTVARIYPGATGQGQSKSEVAKRSGQNRRGAAVLIQRCQTHNQTQRDECRRRRIGHVASAVRGICWRLIGPFDFSPQATQPSECDACTPYSAPAVGG
jgi:hypothetical protein